MELDQEIEMQDSDIRELAAEEMCKTLLDSLLTHIKVLKRPWQEMTETEQEDVIESLRKGVLDSTQKAVRQISSNGAIAVPGTLEVVNIKEDGVKTTIKVSKHAENLFELFDATGKEVLIVCAGNAVYDKGIDEIVADPDQGELLPKDEDGFGRGQVVHGD